MSPAHKRAAAEHLQAKFEASQRRVCRAMNQPRSTQRYEPRRPSDAEQHLVKSLPQERGRNLLKEVRTQLIETARPALEVMVHEVTGVKALSLHHDISTTTGEEIMIFTLDEIPAHRTAKPK